MQKFSIIKKRKYFQACFFELQKDSKLIFLSDPEEENEDDENIAYSLVLDFFSLDNLGEYI